MKPKAQEEPQESLLLRRLFPTLSERELRETALNLVRYLETARRVYEELATSSGSLDSASACNTIKERSKSLKT